MFVKLRGIDFLKMFCNIDPRSKYLSQCNLVEGVFTTDDVIQKSLTFKSRKSK